MRRLVETSQGWLELDATRIQVSGLEVVVTAFEAENGWQLESKAWSQRYSDETFAQTIMDVRGVDATEAERIADETLQQWRDRGGETADRKNARTVLAYLVSTVGLAAIGTAAVVGFVVWLLVRWL